MRFRSALAALALPLLVAAGCGGGGGGGGIASAPATGSSDGTTLLGQRALPGYHLAVHQDGPADADGVPLKLVITGTPAPAAVEAWAGASVYAPGLPATAAVLGGDGAWRVDLPVDDAATHAWVRITAPTGDIVEAGGDFALP